jgi:hypothetical protein
MIGESVTIKRLIQRAERARKEVFELTAEAWNRAVETYARSRPLIVKGDRRGGWLHPWQFSVRWNTDREQWEARINPGFVNGLDATVRVPSEIAPEETLARLGDIEDGERVDSRLTEEPDVPIPMTALRSIGPDGPALGTTGEGFDSRVSYEPVPDFFAALGVGDPPEQTFDTFKGINTSADFLNQESLNARRLLRAVDVVLNQDRPAVAAEWRTGTGADGTIAQFDVTYANTPNHRDRAHVGFTVKHEPQGESDEGVLARLLGAVDSSPFDRLHVATIYFMSPPGEPAGAEVSNEWQPFVKHRLFWNLNHALNRLPVTVPNDNLTFDIPLAGGIGTALANTILATNNDARDAASEFLNARSLKGRFWTT